MQGNIFNIQRYSVNDGPGIRTLVFFKGCPLRCQWCSNPESQISRRQILFFDSLCSQCGACVETCPHECITLRDGHRVYQSSECELCGSCEAACPNSAVKLVGQRMSVQEVARIAEKDYLFYLNSGGGVTLGGGEPTLQADFARALLKELKSLGIHTAMETCGEAPWSVFEGLLPYLNLVLFDVKHMDAATHRQGTGKSNHRILDNLKKLFKAQSTVIVRIPVIPGFNDNRRSMSQIAAFIERHNTKGVLGRVDLLPYHKLGVAKYAALERAYPLDGCKTPTEDLMAELIQPFEAQGFDTLVEYL